MGDGVFEVLSTSGDTHLGGGDFDRRIVDWLADDLKRNEGIDLLKDKQALQRLTETVEKAKIEVFCFSRTNISLPFITATADGPKHIKTTLTRAIFEELCSDLLDRLKRPVENSLIDAKLSLNDIDAVILVGGSSIPSVQDLVRKLTGKETNLPVNPNKVVAVGAAVQADKMVQDVEKFAEEEEKRDAVDTKNQAESVVCQTEKQLKELGDAVPTPMEEKVEAKLKELKDAISGGVTQTIKDAMGALNQEVIQVVQPGARGGGLIAGPDASASDSTAESSSRDDGDVIDADISESK